jgi:hypothetical protein
MAMMMMIMRRGRRRERRVTGEKNTHKICKNKTKLTTNKIYGLINHGST